MSQQIQPQCDLTELAKVSCSHCRGLDKLPATDLIVGRMVTAQFASRCANCDRWTRPGEDIWRCRELSGWICEACARAALQ